MRRLIVIYSLIMLAGCIRENNDTSSKVTVGDTLPSFEVVMNNGETVTENSLMGNVSVLMFFHPSCPDCQQVLPVMQGIYEEYSLKGVYFILISRECDKDEVSAYWMKNGLNLPYSAQNDRDVYDKFADSRIPRIYISDENGIVRYVFTDDPVASYDDLKSSLESLIR